MSQYLKLLGFAKAWTPTQFKNFTSEDLKDEFFAKNPSLRFKFKNTNFGTVMRELAKSGKIIENGFVKSKTPSSKSARILRYISKEYSHQQSENRKNKDEKQVTIF